MSEAIEAEGTPSNVNSLGAGFPVMVGLAPSRRLGGFGYRDRLKAKLRLSFLRLTA